MRDDVSPFWAVVGAACLVVSAGAYALIVHLTRENAWYILMQLIVWALVEILNLTRWRRRSRSLVEGLLAGLLWPATVIGCYWFVRKREHERRLQIVREVMES